MKLKWMILAASIVAVNGLIASDSLAQSKSSAKKPAQTKKTTAKKPAPIVDARLIGITLYDSGASVIAKFGNPYEVQAVSQGGGAIGPAGGGAGGGRGPSVGTSGPGGGGSAPSAAIGKEDIRPGDFFNNELFRQGSAIGDEGDGTGGIIPAGRGGPPIGGAGGRGGAGGGAAGGGGGDRILFTRWIYKVGNSRYGFVFDNSNRVVQIEAIGMNDGRVRTARGVGFGAKFSDLVKRYGAPEGYEINGDAIVVRYLKGYKCAFRLNRLGKDKPHVVTAVVVAGGKA